jgi:isopenicillin-N epimerase
LQQVLFDRHGFELLVYSWPALAARLLRVSAQLYNTSAEYERLAGCLKALAQA